MTIKSLVFNAGTVAILALTAAAHAGTVNIGTDVISTNTQTALLSSTGSSATATATVATTVFENAAGLYTYQYELTNLTDPDGLALFAPTVSGASDFGTSGLTFFFGGAAVGGDVTVDGAVGNDLTNAGFGPGAFNAADTAEAIGSGVRVDFKTSPSIAAGSSNVSQLGDYYYIQSHSGPASADINISDGLSADIQAPSPGPAPEPGSVATFALGGLGLMGLMLRVRKTHKAAA